jgi:hypothetical protein
MIESQSGIEDHLPDLLHIWALHEPHVLRQLAQSFSSHPTHFTRHPSHVLAVQSAQVSPHAEHSLVTDPMRGHELHSTMQALHLFSSVLNCTRLSRSRRDRRGWSNLRTQGHGNCACSLGFHVTVHNCDVDAMLCRNLNANHVCAV